MDGSSHPELAYLLYFGEMFLISFGVFLLFGSMGTIAATLFVCKLYSTVGSQGLNSYVELADADDIEHQTAKDEELKAETTGG